MNKILKISAVVILLVALTYLIVGTFFSNTSQTNTQFSGFGKMVSPQAKISTKSTDQLEVSLDQVLINLHNGDYKYMKSDMSFKMKNASDTKELKNKMPYIRDALLKFTSAQNSTSLASDEGKQKYKEDVKSMIYDSFGLEIEEIYFRNFVLAR